MFLADVVVAHQQRPEYNESVVLEQTEKEDDDHAKLLAYYRANATYPIKPGSDLCMKLGALVVAPLPEGTAILAEGSSLQIGTDVTELGVLRLMATDVEAEFPAFRELYDGREMGALRLLGYEKDGKVVAGSAHMSSSVRTLLPVVTVLGRRYVFAKNMLGEWLLPDGDGGRRVVLAAEPRAAAHLVALESTKALVTKVGEGTATAWEATAAATKPVVEGIGQNLSENLSKVKPMWEDSKAAVGGKLAEVGENVQPMWEDSVKVVKEVSDKTAAAVGPMWEESVKAAKEASDKTAATVGPMWEESVKAAKEAAESTAAAVGPAWEGTVTAVAKGAEASRGLLAEVSAKLSVAFAPGPTSPAAAAPPVAVSVD